MAECFFALDYEAGNQGSNQCSCGIPAGNSVLGGNLTSYWYHRPRQDNRRGNDTYSGLCWK